MSKRRPENHNEGSKKRTKGIPAFGAATDADLIRESQNAPSANAFSVRQLPLTNLPSLITLCIEVYTRNIVELHEQYNDEARYYLKLLPDPLATRMFATLRKERPGVLSHAFIAAYFIKGNEIALDGEMPGVSKLTIDAVGNMGEELRDLELTGLVKISDSVFASAIKKLPNLERLNLRGSTKAGVETAKAVSRCKQLRVLNMSFTSPTPASLAQVLGSCGELEVLKLAGVPNLTPHALTSCLQAIAGLGDANGIEPLAKLTCLKLRQTRVNDVALLSLVDRMPQIQHLDISFTAIQTLAFLDPEKSETMSLEKLSLTSNPLKPSALLEKLPSLIHLRTLNIGAIGDPLNLTDTVLYTLTDKLAELTQLEHVSLVGNQRLGISKAGDHAIADFVLRVGRRCKTLNLGGINRLVSRDLHGLLSDDEPSPVVGAGEHQIYRVRDL
ncbi:hypothetical protein FRC02_007989 [Tulasnella sp. 418]|nr:hypothetical protein FRC02_007989 [Tulasnella sp. 418]